MELVELIDQFPRLYHMAESGTWASIQRHGLLSTCALLDEFKVTGTERTAIEACRRPQSIRISHAKHGVAIIRDQKPLSEKALIKCLQDLTPTEWYRLLNQRVFFWLSEKRLTSLLKARAYRNKSHCVLTLDTKSLVEAHLHRVTLSPINSGSTVYNPQIRGKFTFSSIKDYPFEHWRKKRGRKNAIVELAIDYAVPDIARFVLEVSEMQNGEQLEKLWIRPDVRQLSLLS